MAFCRKQPHFTYHLKAVISQVQLFYTNMFMFHSTDLENVDISFKIGNFLSQIDNIIKSDHKQHTTSNHIRWKTI